MDNRVKLKDKISALPDSPGVYLFKDSHGQIIYIGKAKILKKRVSSYFTRPLDTKTQAMVSKIADLQYRTTSSESLALIFEAALVRRHKPRYNVSLRDDKSFPFVRITNEDFPRICVMRKREADGSRYIGPYTSAGLLREALKTIRRYFPYRSCKVMPRQECMYYRLGLSPAPCTGRISRQDYANNLQKIIMILEGKTDTLIRQLGEEMDSRSRNKEYEAAAKIRDQINALSAIGAMSAGFDSAAENEDLQRLLGLKKPPLRIEAFDISNISGQEACGSMVSFYKGKPDKNNYRRFRIKGVSGIDDYAMIGEIVRRRYLRLIEEGLALPDLILIDGGKAHLAVAKAELRALNLSIPLASIAKEEENIYTTGRAEPLRFHSDTPALNLVRRVRDEAHRFAVSYHHILRRKRIIGK